MIDQVSEIIRMIDSMKVSISEPYLRPDSISDSPEARLETLEILKQMIIAQLG